MNIKINKLSNLQKILNLQINDKIKSNQLFLPEDFKNLTLTVKSLTFRKNINNDYIKIVIYPNNKLYFTILNFYLPEKYRLNFEYQNLETLNNQEYQKWNNLSKLKISQKCKGNELYSKKLTDIYCINTIDYCIHQNIKYLGFGVSSINKLQKETIYAGFYYDGHILPKELKINIKIEKD